MQFDNTKLESIRQKHGLKLVLLYGSQVSGKTHAQSDVDIAVLRNKNNKNLELLQLIADMQSALDSGKVDLVDITHADPLFLRNVTLNPKLLSGSKQELDKLQLKAFKLYQDYKPYLKMERQLVKEKLEQNVTS